MTPEPQRELETLELCPCGKAPECLPGRHFRQVACRRCGRRGPLAPDEGLAIKLWNNDRPKISPLGYEHAITTGWNEHNARRHELIEAKRSRSLSESEITELAELQWLAGIKRELQTGPIQTVDNSPERIRVIVRPGKDDWIGVAYSSSVEPNDVIREYVRPG